MKRYTLTPKQKAFAIAYAETDNATEAVRRAYPELAKKEAEKRNGGESLINTNYLRVKGSRMLTNEHVKAEIADRKAIMQANADLASQRIQTIITEGKEHNALVASIFAIEQADGKAKQVTEVKSEHVSVIYDLSGGEAGEIPADIQAQLDASN